MIKLKTKKLNFKDYKFDNFPSIGKNFNTKLRSLYLFNCQKEELLNYLKLNDKFEDKYLEKIISLTDMQKIRHYKYFRLKKNLPIRGQRTHTNAKTRKKRRVK